MAATFALSRHDLTGEVTIRYWRTIAVSLATLLSALPLGIASAEPTVSPAKSDTASCVRPDFRVVLDVGHPRSHLAPRARAVLTNLISICG